jgi:hypothetical protein
MYQVLVDEHFFPFSSSEPTETTDRLRKCLEIYSMLQRSGQ